MHPGLVDAHVHIENASGLRAVAAAGVVAVRDAGTKQGAGLLFGTRQGPKDFPDVLSAGWALYKKGGYGAAFGFPVESGEDISDAVSRLRNAGAGIIKIMASGIVSLKKPGEITPGGFKPHELEVIVEEAARAGLSVMAHANGDEAIGACALAGVRSVEHGFFMTEKSLGLLAAKGVFWVPTVGALRRAADASGAPDAVRQFIDGLIGRQLAMIRAAYSAGVSLAVGTDRVLPDERYAPAYEAELAHFERAGIPRAEVIRIASEGGARLLGM